MANTLINLAKKSEFIEKSLSDSDKWKEFTEN